MNYPLAPSLAVARAVAPIRSIRVRQIALPSEHGGWGFLAEPLVAGLAIAFSAAGAWIAVLTIGAYLLRQPLRVAVANARGRRDVDIGLTTLRFIALYAGIFSTGLIGTVMTVGTGPLWPFVMVLPFVCVQAYFETFGRSRDLVVEVTGAVSISSSVAAIALAAGLPWQSAAGLWLFFIARHVPSILYVRERLLQEKGKDHDQMVPAAAHGVAFLLVVLLAGLRMVPILATGAMLIFLYRAVRGLSTEHKPMRAMEIGVWEVIYGTAAVLMLVIGHYTAF